VTHHVFPVREVGGESRRFLTHHHAGLALQRRRKIRFEPFPRLAAKDIEIVVELLSCTHFFFFAFLRFKALTAEVAVLVQGALRPPSKTRHRQLRPPHPSAPTAVNRFTDDRASQGFAWR